MLTTENRNTAVILFLADIMRSAFRVLDLPGCSTHIWTELWWFLFGTEVKETQVTVTGHREQILPEDRCLFSKYLGLFTSQWAVHPFPFSAPAQGLVPSGCALCAVGPRFDSCLLVAWCCLHPELSWLAQHSQQGCSLGSVGFRIIAAAIFKML